MMPPQTADVDPQLQHMVDAELRPGEKLIWSEQPLPTTYRRRAIGLFLFGIPWTAFAIFWVSMTSWAAKGSRSVAPYLFFPLFGVPFILIGLGMLASPLWLKRKARGTVYFLTNQRAVVFEGQIGRGANVQSFLPAQLTSMIREERADGSGDLIFAAAPPSSIEGFSESETFTRSKT